MTRKHIIYTIITALALSAIIIIVSMAYSAKGQRAEAHKRELESSNIIIETQEAIGFTLKEFDGELAVFRGESETPYKLLGVSVSLMSEFDRDQLQNGIYVKTEKELKTLIEDFTS